MTTGDAAEDGAPAGRGPTASGSLVHRGHRLGYRSFGAGPRVCVLLHGLLLDSRLNLGLAQALAARDNRVVLLDLVGHGLSDRPRDPSEHRMDLYGQQVVALLDHLDTDQAVLGGVSLGANVSLHAAAAAPDRVRGMVLEMPLLDWAAPAAAAMFVPLLLGVRYLRPLVALVAHAARQVPQSGIGLVDSVVGALATPPDVSAAVLHGVLQGPLAPTAEQRRALTAPTLVIGHDLDLLHPFGDATDLADQLPGGRLVRARSILELRLRPTRLTGIIADFLDEVWEPAGTEEP